MFGGRFVHLFTQQWHFRNFFFKASFSLFHQEVHFAEAFLDFFWTSEPPACLCVGLRKFIFYCFDTLMVAILSGCCPKLPNQV